MESKNTNHHRAAASASHHARRTNTDKKVFAAYDRLKAQGDMITIDNLAREARVHRTTIKRNFHWLF